MTPTIVPAFKAAVSYGEYASFERFIGILPPCRGPRRPVDLVKPRMAYTREAAAFQLSVSLRTLDTLLLTKELRSVKIGRSVRIPADELQRFVKRDHRTIQ
jgi:excisionase family DNA binding protein